MSAIRPLEGKTAIITGAAQGIGRRIAEFLARDGAGVVLADIQEEKARDVARELVEQGHRAEAVFTDVSDPESARQMVAFAVERFEAVDILVNNAGIDAPPGSAWELTEEEWRTTIGVDLSGQWWCGQAVLPHMMGRRTGRIIFISSGSARIGAHDISVAYNAAKAGLIGLTVGLSVQVESLGVLVNAIAPGPTGTGRPIARERLEEYRREVPLGIGGPDPVAHACLYLVRPSGDWVSGAVLNVSGGWWRG